MRRGRRPLAFLHGRADHLQHRRRRTSGGGDGGHRRLPGVPRVGPGDEARRGGRGGGRTGGPSRSTSSSRRPRSRTPTRWATTWHGDSSVTWDLVEGKMLKAMKGAYELRPAGRRHRGDLPTRRRPEHPDDRDAPPQGGEGHHRHRAQGPEEACGVPGLSRREPGSDRPHRPVHRQGRGRQDHHRRGYGDPRGQVRSPDPGALHRRRPLAG